MKVTCDRQRDLLYIWLQPEGMPAAVTETVQAGVFADFDRDGMLVGIEVLDARDVIGDAPAFEVARTQ